MINFLNLKYFVMVANEKNITRVAEKEHISQQALSGHIKKIEDDYGITVFDRSNGFSLTHAGEKLYDYATELLKIKSDMDNELSDLKNYSQGILSIGISYTRGSAFLPEILPLFKKQNPYVKLMIVENNSKVLEDYLLKGHIDVYVGTNTREHPDIDTIDLYSEKLYLVIPKNSVDFVPQNNMSISDFSHLDFLMLTKANKIRKIVDDYAINNNIKLNIQLETENIETLFSLACQGMGITIYPELFLKNHIKLLSSDNCPVYLVQLDNKDFSDMLSIGYNNKRYLSRLARDFISLAQSVFS